MLYGCELYSLVFRAERRLRVFEKRVLVLLFRPKRDEVNRVVDKTTLGGT